MYTMKEVCEKSGLSYETLKFYCNEGLIPNVKRDARNHRVFDDRDLGWIASLLCLRNCGMPLKGMKEFLALCLEGESSIDQRKKILADLSEELEQKKKELNECLDYIQKKQKFYEDVQKGEIPYFSYLLAEYEDCQNPLEM